MVGGTLYLIFCEFSRPDAQHLWVKVVVHAVADGPHAIAFLALTKVNL